MPKSTLQITYIGHATVLIRTGEQYFLTDPNFSQKIPFLKRRRAPGLVPEKLPPLSAILVSQANYDHLDLFSFKFFKSTVPVIVPQGLGKFVTKFLPHPVVEIAAGEQHLYFGTRIHAIPLPTHGFRLFPLRYRAATAYLIQSPAGNVFFTGSTSYGPFFQEISKGFSIDVALLPVRPSVSRSSPFRRTLTPPQALQAMRDLKASNLIPICWGTFGKGKEPTGELEEILRRETNPQEPGTGIHILQPGQSFQWDPTKPPSQVKFREEKEPKAKEERG